MISRAARATKKKPFLETHPNATPHTKNSQEAPCHQEEVEAQSLSYPLPTGPQARETSVGHGLTLLNAHVGEWGLGLRQGPGME